jgi:hypothetical protein
MAGGLAAISGHGGASIRASEEPHYSNKALNCKGFLLKLMALGLCPARLRFDPGPKIPAEMLM